MKFCTWLCFTVIHVRFECRRIASIFVGVMPLLELRILEIHSFLNFSSTCLDILSWNFSYDFVYCIIDQFRVSSLCVRLALRLSINFLHFPPTCIDKFNWNLKFDVGFFNVFLLEKYYIKIAFQTVHDGRIMHRSRCSGILKYSYIFGLVYLLFNVTFNDI